MTDRPEELAQKVVQAFKARLPDATRKQIPEVQFDELVAMIREAISKELTNAAEIVEQAAKELRAAVKRPDIGL